MLPDFRPVAAAKTSTASAHMTGRLLRSNASARRMPNTRTMDSLDAQIIHRGMDHRHGDQYRSAIAETDFQHQRRHLAASRTTAPGSSVAAPASTPNRAQHLTTMPAAEAASFWPSRRTASCGFAASASLPPVFRIATTGRVLMSRAKLHGVIGIHWSLSIYTAAIF